MKVVLNGKTVDSDRARVAADDRGFTHGDGLFETLRAYGGKPFLLDRHLARLRRSAAVFELDLPFTDADAAAWVAEAVEANGLGVGDARLKIMVTRGRVQGPLWGRKGMDPVVLVTAAPLPPEGESRPLRVGLAPWARHSTDPLVRHKTLSYLGSLKARMAAFDSGCDEIMLVNENGVVTEASASNIFWVSDGELFTPALSSGLLPGVTREIVLQIARELGLKCSETVDSHPQTLKLAKEIFITNSIREIAAVGQFQDWTGSESPGSVTRMFMAGYAKKVESLK